MLLTVQEICEKDVIEANIGKNLGRIDDVSFSPQEGKISTLIIYGRKKLFGLLGKDSDIEIPLENVITFGEDVIMVKAYTTSRQNKKKESLLFHN